MGYFLFFLKISKKISSAGHWDTLFFLALFFLYIMQLLAFLGYTFVIFGIFRSRLNLPHFLLLIYTFYSI